MSTDEFSDPVRAHCAAKMTTTWAGFLATAVESMTGTRPSIEIQPAAPGALADELVWWQQQFSSPEDSAVWLGAAREAWTGIARTVLSALGVDDASEGDLESTWRDLMAQSTGMVASGLTHRAGREVLAGTVNAAGKPGGALGACFSWTLTAGEERTGGFLGWSRNLVEFCCQLADQSAEAAPAVAGSPEAVAPDGEEGPPVPRIDLTVKFILGRTTLPLRSVFKLNIGSVLELDRAATDPAEVMVQGRVLARGQVVVVNGNYGLRILPPA